MKIPAHQATIQPGKYLGRDADVVVDNEAALHSLPACHDWIDCLDLGSVIDHEGPLPIQLGISRNETPSGRRRSISGTARPSQARSRWLFARDLHPSR